MVYEKDKIRRLVEHKDKLYNEQIKNDLEWILESYNKYFIASKDFEYQEKEYKNILKKYYNSEEEKANLKEELNLIKRKYLVLKASCKNLKSML